MKLCDIAEKLNCRLSGDGNVEIDRVMGIEEAGPGDLTFVANRKYIPKIKTTKASAIILAEEMPETNIPSLRTDNPYLAFAKSIELFYQPLKLEPGIHSSAVIDPTARIGQNARIGAHVVIQEGVTVGDRVTIYPNVTIYANAAIGSDCVIHANAVIREHVTVGNGVIIQNGAVIGSDGFGFVKQDDGTYYKILQSGTVIIEDHVEIGSNSTIDRAAVGATVIRKGTKIDNLVQIGHGCTVGENVLIAAQAGLGGTTVVGNQAILLGQVGAAGHLRIGDKAIATPQTGIAHSVDDNAIVSGAPAIDHNLWLKTSAALSKLPDALKKIRTLEEEINKLKDNRGV